MSEFDIDGLLGAPRVGPGRQAKRVVAEFSRELTETDLLIPATETQKAPSLKTLRDSHHALARCLATGVKEAEAALVTGYTLSRISVIKADPQFQDLLAFYREQGTDLVGDLRARMNNMGLDALSELQDRLEEKPEDFSVGMLKDIVKDMADRTGHAPNKGSTTNININSGLSEKMAKGRARIEAHKARVIEHDD